MGQGSLPSSTRRGPPPEEMLGWLLVRKVPGSIETRYTPEGVATKCQFRARQNLSSPVLQKSENSGQDQICGGSRGSSPAPVFDKTTLAELPCPFVIVPPRTHFHMHQNQTNPFFPDKIRCHPPDNQTLLSPEFASRKALGIQPIGPHPTRADERDSVPHLLTF